MAITLRSVKGQPLTSLELDTNFSELDSRVTDIEENGGGGSGGIAFTTGAGIDLSNTDVLSHANTSNQGSITNLGRRVVQDISLDQFGHVTYLDNIDLDAEFVKVTGNTTINGNIVLSESTLTAASVVTDTLTVNVSATVDGTISADSFVSSGSGTPTINSASNIVLNAAGAVVVGTSALRLNSYTTVEANQLAGTTGDMIFVIDGNSGSPCAAIWDGTGWKVVSLGANVSTG